MIIFNNLESTGTFSLVLRDKIIVPGKRLFLKIVKQDDLEVIFFPLTDISTSSDYSTFTVDTSLLEQGQYLAFIYEGLTENESDTCYIGSESTIILNTWFPCDPLTLDAVINADAEVLVSDIAELGDMIYKTILRVDGAAYNTVYRNDSSPTYTTYNG